MTIPETEIARVKQCVDLLTLIAGEYRKVANTNGGEYAGPCPFCGGTDRLRIQPRAQQGGRWFCRQCTGEPPTAKWCDAFDYVMQRDGVSFTAAYQVLCHAPVSQCQHADDTRGPAWHSEEWQTRTWATVTKAEWRLRHADMAQSSREYLFSRGLHSETWQAWRLGHGYTWNAHVQQRQPAILLPWHDGPTVQAVQYRFTDSALPKAARYGQIGGGDRHLFGLHLVTGQETLVLVEGEFNAVAIWQACQELSVDVVSWGPQSNIMRPDVAALAGELAAHYKRLLVWADSYIVAAKALAAIAETGETLPPAVVIASPQGNDANDLLIMDELPSFLATLI